MLDVHGECFGSGEELLLGDDVLNKIIESGSILLADGLEFVVVNSFLDDLDGLLADVEAYVLSGDAFGRGFLDGRDTHSGLGVLDLLYLEEIRRGC